MIRRTPNVRKIQLLAELTEFLIYKLRPIV